jgi:hypothetical protein
VVPSLDSLDPKWIYVGLVVYVSEGNEKGLYVYTGEVDNENNGWKHVTTSTESGEATNVSFNVENAILKISTKTKTE